MGYDQAEGFAITPSARLFAPALLAGLLLAAAPLSAESPRAPTVDDKEKPALADKSDPATAVKLGASAPPPPGLGDTLRHHVSIEVSKGRILRIDAPVKTVFIANPNIADVQVKSPTLIYITGKKP